MLVWVMTTGDMGLFHQNFTIEPKIKAFYNDAVIETVIKAIIFSLVRRRHTNVWRSASQAAQ